MFSTTSAARRTLARVAVTSAIAAIPLTASAMPASADPGAPGITEVRYDGWYDRCDFGPFPNWSCNNLPFFGWWGDRPYDRYGWDRPHGFFGGY